MSRILLRNIYKNFNEIEVLKDVNIEIDDGSFTVLLGPSGCGKSTLLRIIAGLEKPDSGEVVIGDLPVTKVEPGKRNVSMVFQNYALYPHLTVYKNIEYGLKARKVGKDIRRQLVSDAIEMVRLEDQVNKLPARMSGGQRQRVALARAIVKRPYVFLMDEPLSNLDAKLRTQMRVELIDLYDRLKTTFLYVTHDQVEAMSMGSSIVILDKGVVQQKGTPQEIYENPANIFVAGFIGSPPANIINFQKYYYAVRPEHIEIGNRGDSALRISGRIYSSEHLGFETIYNVRTELGDFQVRTNNEWNDMYDERVELNIVKRRIMFFDGAGLRIDDEYEKDAAYNFLKEYEREKNGMEPVRF